MRVALCQIPVSSRPEVNSGRVRAALAEAADRGADLAVFPEATQIRFGSDLRAAAEPLDGPFCAGLAAAAKQTGVALVAGVFEPAPDGRVYNTAVAYDGTGELVASYRKLHLFDAFGHRESDQVAPGSAPVICTLAGVRTGLAICYDVRFGELSRALAVAGAALLVLPAACPASITAGTTYSAGRPPCAAAEGSPDRSLPEDGLLASRRGGEADAGQHAAGHREAGDGLDARPGQALPGGLGRLPRRPVRRRPHHHVLVAGGAAVGPGGGEGAAGRGQGRDRRQARGNRQCRLDPAGAAVGRARGEGHLPAGRSERGAHGGHGAAAARDVLQHGPGGTDRKGQVALRAHRDETG